MPKAEVDANGVPVIMAQPTMQPAAVTVVMPPADNLTTYLVVQPGQPSCK